jgi:hypothetical protein
VSPSEHFFFDSLQKRNGWINCHSQQLWSGGIQMKNSIKQLMEFLASNVRDPKQLEIGGQVLYFIFNLKALFGKYFKF